MNKFLRLVMFGDCFFTYRVMALWLAETRCRKRERAVSRFPINSIYSLDLTILLQRFG